MKTDPKSQLTGPAQSDLNHAMRTALNDILGFASLLESHASDRDREDIQRILRAGRQVLDLIGGNLPQADTRVPNAPDGSSEETLDNLLYVEDNDANFVLVSCILEMRGGVNLIRAECGESAVKLATEVRPDLILLDLNLPDIHGSVVLQRLQAQPATRFIPVVVISADSTPSQIERLLSAGARNYLTKPFSMEMLLAVIDDVLGSPSSSTRS